MLICLERGANDLHMVQLMPLPPHHLSLQQNPEWFTFLVPAYPGCPEKRPLTDVVVVVSDPYGYCSVYLINFLHLVLSIAFFLLSCLVWQSFFREKVGNFLSLVSGHALYS